MPHYRVLYNGRDREEWLKWREGTLGASEAPAVCGVSRFSSPLKVFADKVEGSIPFDNPIVRFGRVYEHQIARDFQEQTGRRLKLDGRLIASRRHPWMSCTLDARQWREDRPDPGLAEIKTDLYGWDKDGIPIGYWTQIQHQFAVTGFKWGSAIMFNRTNCETVYKDVEPDPEFIRALLLRESFFWHRCVLPGIPPQIEDDDSTKATKETLLRLYPQSQDGERIALGVKAMKARDRLAFAKENLARYKLVKDASENQLKSYIGDAEGGIFSDGSGFTLKTDVRGFRTLRAKERM